MAPNIHDTTYLQLAEDILSHGKRVPNRTKWATFKVFGRQARFNLHNGFPLLTTKKINFDDIVHELLWIISGGTNIKYLVDNHVSIWTDWPLKYYNSQLDIVAPGAEPLSKKAFEQLIRGNDIEFAKRWGELGPVYGAQWREWKTGVRNENGELVVIDQLAGVIETLRNDPRGRRHIVTAWNPSDIPDMLASGLPPCHCFFQFDVEDMPLVTREAWLRDHHPVAYYDTNGWSALDDAAKRQNYLDEQRVPKFYLNLQLYQRSCDLFLGVPYNIASYSLLLQMVAQVVGMIPNEFIHTYGDLHIYENHLEQMTEQVKRGVFAYKAPTVALNPAIAEIDDFKFSDIGLRDYQSHSRIAGEVAV